jgi:hypothetical protein
MSCSRVFQSAVDKWQIAIAVGQNQIPKRQNTFCHWVRAIFLSKPIRSLIHFRGYLKSPLPSSKRLNIDRSGAGTFRSCKVGKVLFFIQLFSEFFVTFLQTRTRSSP